MQEQEGFGVNCMQEISHILSPGSLLSVTVYDGAAKMSKRLLAERQRSPAPRPSVLLLSLSALLLASPRARGQNVDSKLESLRQQMLKDQSKDYEITVPLLLNGEQWRPANSIYSKNHPSLLQLVVQAEGERLVIHLERNEGIIVFENKSYILEPLEGATNEHKIYRAENLEIIPGSCGHQLDISATRAADPSHRSQGGRYKRETLKTTKYVELVIVADNREFQRQGKDVEKIKQRLIEIANYVDKFYRPLNIRVALVGVEVWNDMDKCSISQDPFTSLHEFLDWRKLKLLPRKPHDNAQLISGVYFQGTTIGMAPIMSMCTAEQSGGVVMDHSENPLGAAVTLAHELGHNFGMNHDTLERGCNCKASTDKGGCIMNPSTGYPFPMVFSSCSRKDLENSLEKGVGMCLFNLPEVKESFGGQKCGNGYVEDGEECDCGEPDECTNRCCNATTCTLRPGAVCAHGLCCEDCKLKPAGISCRESSNSCDLPEFCTGASPHCPANVYLHDGHACHGVDGYCYNGICQTHEQQCITLWGQGAKPAPGICFERVNSAGDPYGNCGKDSKSSFAKCEPRDAKCGKIQCQGGANRPVIGTNAVSIETNIPLQEGGKILCRGTHVYLGDDMPDPGLVLSGTKCEDGKICLNRRCQNTSVFGVHKCATKCHGRGVCNNKKNCHCEADWAPPYCDKPGFGGSVDSGPIRQADNKSLTVGVLITILCLTFAGSVMYLKRKTLMRLLFTSKKTTIEKLRSVSPARSSRSSKLNHVRTTSLSKNLIMKPQNANVQKRDGPRRPLPYQIVDISDPVKTHHVPQLKTPQRVLPPLPQPPCHQAGPERPLPANPTLRLPQENHKPSPPRKPLPADPLNKTRYNSACTPGLGHTKALPHIAPARPAPKHPPPVPRSSNATADVK
uniref:ADAM metallopeptidase domain 12 n=1 Tax=Gallus gallus TaxID=9031 RepID=A0A8V0XH69_CHICK